MEHPENSSSTVGVNFMADWTDEEFKGLQGYLPSQSEEQYPNYYSSETAGSPINWR